MKKGTRILLELRKYLGSDWHLPLLRSISGNFLLNGGCDALVPTSGLTPESVKASRLLSLPKEIVESSLRIGHFGDTSSDDHCFFKLDPSSLEKTYEMFFKEVERIRVRPGDVLGTRRPCLFGVGVDRLEAIFGDEVLGQYYQRGAALTRQRGDVGLLIVKHSTKSNDKLADLVDAYLKLDEIDGTLVIYSLKPPSRIYQVEYDYSRSYPCVGLTPVA